MFINKNNIFLNILKIFIFLNILNFVYCEDAKKESDVKEEERPKVSIIIPAYNAGKYIERCVESALNQTLKEIQVIVVNDKSTDNTEELLKKYESDERFISVTLNKNQGPASARNVGIELALGEFIGFIDSDDKVDPNFFENLYKLSKDKDVIIGIFVNSTNDTEEYFHHSKFILYGCVGDTIWRRSFINEHNIRFVPGVSMGEDLDFRTTVYNSNPRKLEAPDEGSYYYYKRREGSLMNYSNGFIEGFTKTANNSNESKNRPNGAPDNSIFGMNRNVVKYSVISVSALSLVVIGSVFAIRKYKKSKYNELKEEEEARNLNADEFE